MNASTKAVSQARNVFGKPMQICCLAPVTGFYRDGFCHFGEQDMGVHGVCAVMTEAFLSYTKKQGNDLSTPVPAYGFPGLKPGDAWCLCASRWLEAYHDNMAPKLKLESCHEVLLDALPLQVLKTFASE